MHCVYYCCQYMWNVGACEWVRACYCCDGVKVLGCLIRSVVDDLSRRFLLCTNICFLYSPVLPFLLGARFQNQRWLRAPTGRCVIWTVSLQNEPVAMFVIVSIFLLYTFKMMNLPFMFPWIALFSVISWPLRGETCTYAPPLFWITSCTSVDFVSMKQVLRSMISLWCRASL